MRRLALFAAVLVALAGVAWILSGQRRPPTAAAGASPAEERASPRPERRAAALASPAVPGTREALVEAPAGAERVALAPEPDSAPLSVAGAIVGRVVLRADGTPVAGARVRAGLSPEGSHPREPRRTVETRSLADGSFRLEVAEAGELIWIEALGTERSASSGQLHRRAHLAWGRVIELELAVGAGGSVSGTVVDAEGRGVPGAEVRSWSHCPLGGERGAPERLARSGFDGSFALEHVGPQYWIEAGGQGLVCTRALHGELADGERVEGLVVRVGAPWRLRARVVDAAGRGIAGARIEASSDHYREGATIWRIPTASVESDERGDFVLSDLPPGPTLYLSVDHDAWLSRQWEGDANVAQPVSIRMEAGGSRSGTVLGPAGAPVAGARVVLLESRSRTRHEATTDAQGRFRLRGLPAGEGFLGVHAEGLAIHVEELPALDPGAPETVVRLAPGLRLAGRVVDAEGRPLAGASLRAAGERWVVPDLSRGDPMTWEWVLDLQRASTDRTGRFAFEDLYPGTFTLRITSPGDSDAHAKHEARAGDEDLLIRLDAALRGNVRPLGTQPTR